jgi:hypothetical protein
MRTLFDCLRAKRVTLQAQPLRRLMRSINNPTPSARYPRSGLPHTKLPPRGTHERMCVSHYLPPLNPHP